MNDESLRDACEAWQGGRDGGSSPIRAAARVLTGTTHYFSAHFIDEHERAARHNDTTMRRARVLLDALADGHRRDPEEWSATLGFGHGWVGRGIDSGPQDEQILRSLERRTLDMPLWGASLDPAVANDFGSGFLFVIRGSFPAVPAWLHSGSKPEESELIVGGRYTVVSVDGPVGQKVVELRYEAPIVNTDE